MKTTWNLELLYKSPNDPQIEKDMRDMERAFAAFEKKYKGKTDYLKNEGKLLAALTDFEALFLKRPIGKPYSYFQYIQCLNSEDATARAQITKLQERFAKNDQRVVFFDLAIGKIPAPFQKKFLKSKRLAHFRYHLKNVFDKAKHNLSEAEERIMALKAIPAHAKWVDGTDKLTNKATVEWKGEKLPLAKATSMIHELQLPDRHDLHDKTMAKLAEFAPVAESELNAIVTNKKIDDELRGFKEPFDSTILGYQNDRKSVLALVDAVTKNFGVSHRFYRLKAKLMGLERLRYADRAVGVAKEEPKVTFEEAVKNLRDVFGSLDKRYIDILNSYLEKGQIDVFPKVGKTGGAFCSGNLNAPTFVLLNHTESFDKALTFAHEMGHAIHTEFADRQPPLYRGYSIATAEVASTLFEQFVFDAMFEKLSDKEKVAALSARLNDDVQTVFRQIACFNFERELHETVREKGAMTEAEIRALMNKHMAAYLGPVFDLKDLDGNYFVDWGHLRNFFYVYAYAFGQLISKALYANFKKDRKYLTKINAFMEAGGSDSPENIFKSVGIDVTKPAFWEAGLRQIEKDIEALEKLTKKG